VKFPDWGAADIPFIRLATPQYAESGNGNAPRRSKLDSELLNTRTIAAAFPEHNNPDTRVTSMMMQFGQFLDHDISSTSFPEKRCCVTPGRPECFNIYVSSGDVTFTQRHNSSATCIDFARSRPACGLKQREQVNTITSFIDASNVYGSDVETADVLRSKTGGKLIENSKAPGQLPTKEQLNRLSDHLDDRLDFVAGDSRVNEQPFLTGLHVLFVREHNRLAERLQKDLQVDNDELLYQSARKLVIVEMQNIAYKEFLPVLLGQRFVKKYKLAVNKVSKYNEKVNPSLFNSFAGAAFRFGHSMINGLFKVIISNKEIFWRLSDLFNGNKFNGNNMLEIEPMIEGLLKQNAQKVDGSFADELTNHLFSEHSPKRHDRFGGDLVARNIQRGRDHGLPGYNTFRRICGLNPVTSFAKRPQEIPHHIWRRLKSLYKHVDDIDVYPAGISETPLDRDSLLGPTFSCLIGLQFHNLKFGDSFFFSHDRPSPNYIKDLLEEMKSRRLSNVICDNTKIVEVQVNAMEAPNNVTNPIKECRRETSLTPRSLVFPEDSEKETPKDLEKETPEAPEEEGTDSKPVRFTEEDAMATEDDLSGVEP
jgi:peroxidase